MTWQGWKKRWIWGLSLGILILSAALGGAQDLLRFTRNQPGDSKPINWYADEITTWTESGQRIVVLKGRVLVQQGVTTFRAQRAVGWIDEDRWKRTRIYHVELFGEGEVQIENGTQSKNAPKAMLELNTRGELRFKSQTGKVVQQSRPDDPLYQRARAERPPPPSGVQPAGGPVPNPGGLQRTSFQPVGPAPQPIVPVQGFTPSPGTPPSSTLMPPVFGPGGPSATPPPGATAPPPPSSGSNAGTPGRGEGASFPTSPRPGTSPLPPTNGPPRVLSIAPRTSAPFETQSFPLPTGEQAIVITGGIILRVNNMQNMGIVDIEADRLVFWTRGNTQQVLGGMRSPSGQSTRELELYLAGNVEIRQRGEQGERTLKADQVYYDVGRNVAVAVSADLEFHQPGLTDPVHLKADELLQLSSTKFEAIRAEVFSSRLPSDPGLKVTVAHATLEEKRIPRKSIFGRQVVDRQTGNPAIETQSIFRGEDMILKLEDYPVFYLPFIQGDARDPLGPVEAIGFGYNRIFGAQFATTLNVYDLLGIDPLAGTRWRLNLDYLTRRGPAMGTDFDYAGKDLFEIPSKYAGMVKAFGIYDTGTDILGGPRGPDQPHPDWRGRLLWRQNWWDLPAGFTVQLQVSGLSDKNFLEQYYKLEFDTGLNQETFAYVKQQQDNWAWTLLGEPNIRNWVTETQWLPRADGYLIGQSFLDLFTYNAHADVGFGILQPTHLPPPPISATDAQSDTARLDLWQELSLPFYLGPVRVAPYGIVDLTYYSNDLTGEDRGRFYGAGGVRANMPLTRLYPDIQSELINLNGINHKVMLGANWYAAHSDTTFRRLPQLDRINDDATDQAIRDIRPLYPAINPSMAAALTTSPLYDPQVYALRRLVDNRVDTLDTIEVLQMDIRQRWQTKRGYPGLQHIVDWMTLDMSASYFPHNTRDNFGSSWAFLEYDWTWNIGDRTALVSTGWIDPIDDGAKVFTLGAYINRPDRTSYYVGYRHIDPLDSRALTGALTYIFSPKYALTGAAVYDFGTNQSLANSLVLTRMGKDLQLSFGINYNALQNNFGVTFEIMPNIVPQANRPAGSYGSRLFGR